MFKEEALVSFLISYLKAKGYEVDMHLSGLKSYEREIKVLYETVDDFYWTYVTQEIFDKDPREEMLFKLNTTFLVEEKEPILKIGDKFKVHLNHDEPMTYYIIIDYQNDNYQLVNLTMHTLVHGDVYTFKQLPTRSQIIDIVKREYADRGWVVKVEFDI